MATLRQLLLVRRPPATSAIRRQLSPAAARWRLAASAGGYNVRMDMQSLVAPIRRHCPAQAACGRPSPARLDAHMPEA